MSIDDRCWTCLYGDVIANIGLRCVRYGRRLNLNCDSQRKSASAHDCRPEGRFFIHRDLEKIQKRQHKMKALSIRQPWAWAIMHAGKNIENRTWGTKFRGRIYVHAGKGMTRAEYHDARMFMVNAGLAYPTDPDLAFPPCIPDMKDEGLHRGFLLGTVKIVDCITKSNSPWFFGPFGFVLEDPQPFDRPIPCRGMLGLFEPRPENAILMEGLLK